MDFDVFISHAWEDKESFVRPLAEALKARGLRVWYDEFTITVGDSLRRSIDRGLANSRYGIVVLSPNFFAKEWPQKELDGLVAREVNGEKVILPIWHRVDASDVRAYSPILADRVAVTSSKKFEDVIAELLRAIQRKPIRHAMMRKHTDNEVSLQKTPQRTKRKSQSVSDRNQVTTQVLDLSFQLSQAESHSDWDKAIELGENILRLNAYHLDAHFKTIKYRILRGTRRIAIGSDLEGALTDFSRVIELDPNRPSSYHYRGLVYVMKNDREAARSDFERAAAMGYEDAKKELRKL